MESYKYFENREKIDFKNNPTCSVTFTEYTDESIENGCSSDNGFLSEDETIVDIDDFDGVIDKIRQLSNYEWSTSPIVPEELINGGYMPWISGQYSEGFRVDEPIIDRSYHFKNLNIEQAKYLLDALK